MLDFSLYFEVKQTFYRLEFVVINGKGSSNLTLPPLISALSHMKAKRQVSNVGFHENETGIRYYSISYEIIIEWILILIVFSFSLIYYYCITRGEILNTNSESSVNSIFLS
jgi:predicted ABC-type sugar transport system permease subunit